MHCLILLLRKENASHHVPALVTGNAFTAQQHWKGLHFSVCELNINSLTTAVTLQGIFTENIRAWYYSFAVCISTPMCELVTTAYPIEQVDLCLLVDLQHWNPLELRIIASLILEGTSEGLSSNVLLNTAAAMNSEQDAQAFFIQVLKIYEGWDSPISPGLCSNAWPSLWSAAFPLCQIGTLLVGICEPCLLGSHCKTP